MSIPSLLKDFLLRSDAPELTLTFVKVEAILGAPLPDSARRYQAYWSAGNNLGRVLLEAGWRASPHLERQTVTFRRVGTTPSGATSVATSPDLVLIGCVKTKRPGLHIARELYVSTLFRGRVARSLATGAPWFVLSAKYGLLHPDDEVESYDETLLTMSGEHRQRWSQMVLRQLAERFGDVRGTRIEIHAGYEYRASGLVSGLTKAGAAAEVPLEGLGLGEQLAWYGRYTRPDQPPAPASPSWRRDAVSPLISRDRAHRLARLITEDFQRGTFDLSGRAGAPIPGWDALPEFAAAAALEERGASAVEIRRFCTFLAAMDRARDADMLWQRGIRLHSEQPWVFDPSDVVGRPLHHLREALARSGTSQRHSVDTAGWRLIAEALVAQESPGEVVTAINDGIGDAPVLLHAVRALTAAGQPWYPLLSGPKVSVMWVRMLAAPGKAAIQNLSVLPVAVDVQVRKVTEYLGVTDTAGRELENVRDVIQDAWAGAPSAVGPEPLAGTAAALDPAIWFMGKWGCSFCERSHSRRPIGSACADCRFGGQS